MQRKTAAEVDQSLPKDVPEAQAVEVANGDNIAKEMILQTVDLDLDRAPNLQKDDPHEIGIATDREKDRDSVEIVKGKENMKEVNDNILFWEGQIKFSVVLILIIVPEIRNPVFGNGMRNGFKAKQNKAFLHFLPNLMILQETLKLRKIIKCGKHLAKNEEKSC